MRRITPIVLAGLALVACAGDPTVETASQTAPATGTAPATPAPATAPPATAAPATTGQSAPVTAAPATDAPATDAPVVAPEALRFTAPLIGGGALDVATLAGRPVLLWFWAPG